jgi:sugar-specific transcriptional regulator TrmB
MSQEIYKESIKSLSDLGFTELEAAIYSYLVENSPATPYRVARKIGKPIANTYKAVESLYQKGAVLIDKTNSRSCQAVPPSELLGRLKQSFLDRYEVAADALSHLKPSGNDEKIFSLATSAQTFDRCQKLIDQAESIILVDAFPGMVEILKPWLEKAAERQVTVVLQVYEPTNLKGVEIVNYQAAELSLGRWQGQWLIVVVDGAEYLFAYMSEGGTTVHNAIWCGSAFLALPQHSNLALSFRASIMEELFKKNAPRDEIQRMLKRTKQWLTMGKRGYSKLTGSLGETDI